MNSELETQLLEHDTELSKPVNYSNMPTDLTQTS